MNFKFQNYLYGPWIHFSESNHKPPKSTYLHPLGMTIFWPYVKLYILNGPIIHKWDSREGPEISTFLHPLGTRRVCLSYHTAHIIKFSNSKLPLWAPYPHFKFYSSHYGLNLLIIWPCFELTKMITSHIYSRSTNLILVRSHSNPYFKSKLPILEKYSHIRI